MKQTAVLRIYKGNEILMKADGITVANENQQITLTYDDLQWKAHLQNIKKMGVCKVEVVEFYEGNEKAEIPTKLTAEIEALLKTPENVLSPEQETIKALKEQNRLLEERMNALESGNANQTPITPVAPAPANVDDTQKVPTQAEKDLAEATEKYKAKFNKDVVSRFKNDIVWINKELAKEL